MLFYWYFKFIFFIIFFTNYYQGNAKETELVEQFKRCCDVGSSWAREDLKCEKFTGPVAGVPNIEQGLCLETVDICCIRTFHERSCEKGKKDAREGLTCTSNTDKDCKTRESDYQRDCCEGCKLGILTGSLNQKCALNGFSFGNPWDEAFLECCYETTSSSTEPTFSTDPSKNQSSTDTTLTTISSSISTDPSSDKIPTPDLDDICQILKGLLCSDICVPTPGSYYCECPKGKVLLEDGKTCRTESINRCESDNPCEHRCIDTGTDVKCECDPGFLLSDDGHSCNLKPKSSNVQTTESPREPPSRPKCPFGYRYNSTLKVCNDIDECAEKADLCGDEICYNQPGGYSCVRAPIPFADPTTITTKRNNDLQLSSTTELSIPEKCRSGMKYIRNRGCVDLNECHEIEDACTSNEECVNTIGSYICNCRVGFRRDNFTQACVDINECQLLENDCLPSQRCDNTLGSYTCVRFLPCGTGYTLNAATEICEDDDECVLGTHDCGSGYHCRNTLGSYRCDRNARGQNYTQPPLLLTTRSRITTMMTTTPYSPITRQLKTPSTAVTRATTLSTSIPVIGSRNKPDVNCPEGFEVGSNSQCIDIDECQSKPSPCQSPLQRCVNTMGSFKCESRVICGIGYTFDPVSSYCVDVDECSTGMHQCGHGQTCENRQGGYTCSCPPGHTISPNRQCIDIDECSIFSGNICGASGRCENTVGSYRCLCDAGFEKSSTDNSCQDINECERNQGICQHSCFNVWGSYRCACRPGFRINSDNKSCSDIDECVEFKDNNLCVGICENTPGSYSCRCPEGYRLGIDGRTCQDIDECAMNQMCQDPNEICQNTRGGFRCNKINCPGGYHRDHERKNRCIRTSRYCPSGDLACFRSPSHFSFNFITFVSFLPIPIQTGQLELFTMRGTHLPGSIVRFSMALVDSRAPPGVVRATESFFALRRPSPTQAVLCLTRSIGGPQEIELDLSMEIYHSTSFAGSAVAKIFIYVSQYEF